MQKSMLGAALCEVRGLFKDLMDKLCGEDWEKWLEALKRFLRGEPVWAEEMMYKPIDWGRILGSINWINDLDGFLETYNKQLPEGEHWRLPTITELERGLAAGIYGFAEGVDYYSSTPDTRQPGLGNRVMEINHGNLCGSDSCSIVGSGKRCHLRLCRQKKLD